MGLLYIEEIDRAREQKFSLDTVGVSLTELASLRQLDDRFAIHLTSPIDKHVAIYLSLLRQLASSAKTAFDAAVLFGLHPDPRYDLEDLKTQMTESLGHYIRCRDRVKALILDGRYSGASIEACGVTE
jgi:hypothetical protein